MSVQSNTVPTRRPVECGPEQLRHLVQVASLAPSVHNSQPWRFVERSAGLDLLADGSRKLDVLDPLGRLMHLSCGAALLQVRVGARALGLDPHVTLLPDGEDAERLAHVSLVAGEPPTVTELALATAVLHRHTYRGRFEDRPLGDAVLGLLSLTAESEKACLVPVERGDGLLALEVLLSRAESAELRNQAYLDELARWVRDDVTTGDGIPTSAVVKQRGRASSVTLRDFDPAGPNAPSDDGPPPAAERPAVMVLTTNRDDRRAWLEAGQALGAVLLQAADLGILAQPLGQVTDVEASRVQLAVALGLVGVPQLVLRLGFASGTAQTPRRDVEDLLAPR